MSTPFQDAMRRRLQMIDMQGDSQTTWERLQAQRKQAESLVNQQSQWQQSLYNRLGLIGNSQSQIAKGFRSGNSGLEAFINQIGLKESHNNYNARNKSGAMGKYQIMPSNLGGKGSGWDYEALGYDVTPSQFMGSAELQEQIARYKLAQYYQSYGPAGAAIAWYAGPSAAAKYKNTGYTSTSTESGGYPSVYSYMQSIMGGL